MEVIQDWGSDYLYLRHDGVTTRFNLFDHTYRDVVRNPVDDFESFSSGFSPPEAGSSGYLENAWMFQDPIDKALAKNRYLTDKAFLEEDYMPHPFPDHLLMITNGLLRCRALHELVFTMGFRDCCGYLCHRHSW